MKYCLRVISIVIVTVVLFLSGLSCAQPSANSQERGRTIALEFVKQDSTYLFDGIATTLTISTTLAIDNGWKYTIKFDSRHAGYGDRTGQVLADVITHHTAEVTVQGGKVVKGIIDGNWDMINQRLDVEVKLAPIEEVRVNIMKSNPAQIGVYIKGGLSDGCTTYHDIEISRDSNIVNIKVTVQRPRGVNCPAIYTWFEKDVNLGTDFAFGTTYILNVNDYSTTFDGTLMK